MEIATPAPQVRNDEAGGAQARNDGKELTQPHNDEQPPRHRNKQPPPRHREERAQRPTWRTHDTLTKPTLEIATPAPQVRNDEAGGAQARNDGKELTQPHNDEQPPRHRNKQPPPRHREKQHYPPVIARARSARGDLTHYTRHHKRP